VDVDPEPANVDPEPGAAGAALRVVAGDGVNVRTGPATDSDRLFALPGGAPVTIAASEQGWVRIVAPDGRSGWVYEKFLLMPP
ncbi:SH3 domain-containing protein, partial [Devosia sp.]|uniref:SH3 domain-containing protein n=1 Tax=Devosia sp. TaxID=1871048 RepID=UPI002F0D3474